MPRHGEDVAGLSRSARGWAITEETRSNHSEPAASTPFSNIESIAKNNQLDDRIAPGGEIEGEYQRIG
jgi:hypothetical protein